VLTNKVLDQAVGSLMAAYKDCHPYDPDATPLSASIFTSTRHSRFWLGTAGRKALKHAVGKCDPRLDQYPIQAFEAHLRQVVADVTESTTTPTEASAELRSRLVAFFQQLDSPDELEVVTAVFGLSAGQEPFSLGPCRFYIMDEAEYHRWGQRERSGRYDPPAETPVLNRQVDLDRQVIGNWVSAVRVHAVDSTHAQAKARYRLEEVLNVLRFAIFPFGLVQHCPRAGLGRASFWNDHALCMRVHPPGAFTRSLGQGADGLLVETCRYSPAWADLERVVAKEASARTELEWIVMTAIEWAGQAAAAPLAPVRLVSLATALEVLVMGEHESLGKRSKLSKRAGKIVSDMRPGVPDLNQAADDLYRLRSECLHQGRTQIEDSDVTMAYTFVSDIIAAFLAKEPYCKCQTLTEVLGLLEPVCELTYEI
jgi:hypothetical protein